VLHASVSSLEARRGITLPLLHTDSDPPSGEDSSVNSGEGKQHFVSMARCVGAGVSSAATRPSEMTESAVTWTTQSSRILMVETFELHKELKLQLKPRWCAYL
jgi:hypothetical protein